MKNNKIFNIFLYVVLAILLLVVFIFITNRLTGKKVDNKEVKENEFSMPISDIISDKVNEGILPITSDTFSYEYETQTNTVYCYNNIPVNETGDGFWQKISEDEYFMYRLNEVESVKAYGTMLEEMFPGLDVHIEPIGRQIGFLGLTNGGYATAMASVDDSVYYLLSYYIEGEISCAYMTSDANKLLKGYDLVTENIKTMIYPEEYLDNTGEDGEEPDITPISDPYINEIKNDAKYCNITVKKNFTKMRVLFTAEHFNYIDNIYMRRMKDDTIIYQAEGEEHEEDEAVFVVDNVNNGEEFQFVIFSDRDIGKFDACTVEYTESEAVKARNKAVQISDN